MGSGKSSIARAYSKKNEYYFLDTDDMIESLENRSIDKIFEAEGEAYFRSLEKELVSWLKDNVSHAIISTGGGMLQHCEQLKELGTVIYLEVPFSTIVSRMSPSELQKRPLFQDKEEAKSMYEQRDSIYRKNSDLILDADCSINELVSRLSSAIASL